MSDINQVDTNELYDNFHLQSVIHSPKADVLALEESEDCDLPYDYYDDLYHTFMGSDDEVRDGCWE